MRCHIVSMVHDGSSQMLVLSSDTALEIIKQDVNMRPSALHELAFSIFVMNKMGSDRGDPALRKTRAMAHRLWGKCKAFNLYRLGALLIFTQVAIVTANFCYWQSSCANFATYSRTLRSARLLTN